MGFVHYINLKQLSSEAKKDTSQPNAIYQNNKPELELDTIRYLQISCTLKKCQQIFYYGKCFSN